jgi:predicted PurR-regulated permease PerM
MHTSPHKVIEYSFFFALLIGIAYLMWVLIAPFAMTLCLAAIVVSISYPLYERVYARLPHWNGTLAALLMLLLIIFTFVLPLIFLGALLIREAFAIGTLFNSDGAGTTAFLQSFERLEAIVQQYVPNYSMDVAGAVQQTAQFVGAHIMSIFASTASSLFLIFIASLATFYFFRDGRQLIEFLINLSPLDNLKDSRILSQVALAVRGVAMGTVSVALIQGILTAIGLAIFGFDRAVLWGAIAAIGALVPGVGTTIVFVPAVIYLFVTGATLSAVLLLVWAVLAVGLIDNLLGPYVMSRSNNVHPFLILISVLGGIMAFGPFGFIVGPVILAFFLTLLQIYHTHYERSGS